MATSDYWSDQRIADAEHAATWPTQEQFDAASANGCEYALAQQRAGRTEPMENPVSGEWVDSPTPRDIARAVGWDLEEMIPAHEGDAVDELTDAWERGYADAWRYPAQAYINLPNSQRIIREVAEQALSKRAD